MAKSPVSDRAIMVEGKYGKTLGASKGRKPAPQPKVSLKGTNPLKGKFAVTVTKKF
jgi:hypothetical protein